MRGWKIQACGLAFLGALFFLVPQYSNAQVDPRAQQYYQAGTTLYNQKNYSQAAKYYQAAFKISPNYAEAYQGIGSCWYAMGNKQYALAYFNKALAINPNNTRLAQFVQSMGGQAPAGGTTTPAAGGDALAQGNALFQQQQYAPAIGYYQQAIQQNPNDYRAYFYAGYSYSKLNDSKNAALYFTLANDKQPNASTKAYADRVKATLSADDQRWVDDQAAKLSQGGASAQAPAEKIGFGLRLIAGMGYGLADPVIVAAGQSVNANTSTTGLSVDIKGSTPDSMLIGGAEGFYKFSPNLEVDFGASFSPVGDLAYTSIYNNSVTAKYNYTTSIIDIDLGARYSFGSPGLKFYLGLAADICPVSLNFSKTFVDASGNPIANTFFDVSGASYSAMAIGGHVQFGVDLSLGPGISLGPYIGYRFLSVDSFKGTGGNLVLETTSSDVGDDGGQYKGVTTTVPFKSDYSSILGGWNVNFTF